MIRVAYFMEVTSSWCYWAEPAWAELKAKYREKAEFSWKIALLDQDSLPVSRQQLEWFYRRSGTIVRSPFMLNSGWYEHGMKEYLTPNLLAEAAKDFGVQDDRVRLAVAHAALREGRCVSDWDATAQIAASAAGLNSAELKARAQSAAVEDRVRASTSEFHALKVTQRPAFVIENGIGDKTVLSGAWRAAPIAAAIDAMVDDETAYLAWAAHFGNPPAH